MDKIIKNLTPHTINIVGYKEISPSGIIVRCELNKEQIGVINGIPICKTFLGEVYNLPEKEDGTIYIVSRQVAEKAKRNDLYIVDDAVRDEGGKIIGVKGLAQLG